MDTTHGGRATFGIDGAYVVGEIGVSEAQAKSIIASCSSRALRGLSTEESTNLKAAIRKVQESISKSLDVISKKRASIRENRNLLNKELESLGDGSVDLANMTRLAAPAIASCADVSKTMNDSSSYLNLLYGKSTDLQYKLKLSELLDEKLKQEQDSASATIASLDRIHSSMELRG